MSRGRIGKTLSQHVYVRTHDDHRSERINNASLLRQLATGRTSQQLLSDACEIRGHEMLWHILNTEVLQVIPE